MPKLTDPTRPKDRKIDLAKVPRGFTLQEWALLVEEFKNWPFRPQVTKSSALKELLLITCPVSLPSRTSELKPSLRSVRITGRNLVTRLQRYLTSQQYNANSDEL